MDFMLGFIGRGANLALDSRNAVDGWSVGHLQYHF